MKYLPIFNKGDKVKVNDKYLGLKSMKGEVYTIQAGPVKTCGTWCYFLERVAGEIAADALEPEKQTNEEWLNGLSTKDKAKWIAYQIYYATKCDVHNESRKDWSVEDWEKWLKEKHDGE